MDTKKIYTLKEDLEIRIVTNQKFNSTAKENELMQKISKDLEMNCLKILKKESKFDIELDKNDRFGFRVNNLTFEVTIPVIFKLEFNPYPEDEDEDRHLINILEISGVLEEYISEKYGFKQEI